MKILKLSEARRIAHEVACWLIYEINNNGFELDKWRHMHLIRWFHTGNHDLGGFCWMAAFIIVKVLRARGISCGVAIGRHGGHGYVITECGKAIDATCMQFNKPAPLARKCTALDLRANGAPLVAFMMRDAKHASWWAHPTMPRMQMKVVWRICKRMGVGAGQ